MIIERVRFAPSPTGPLHVGGLRTALFNFLYTRSRQGKFILRLEDTDRSRYVENSDSYIEEALEWVGITPDEGPSVGGNYGPYRQSERVNIYKEKIKILIDSDNAYYAFDSTERLNELRKEKEKKGLVFKYDYSVRGTLDNSLTMSKKTLGQRIKKESYVIRLKVDSGVTKTKDVLRGKLEINNDVLDDKILMKADGFPTYHFANVVDDHLMKITTVIRGEEWLPSIAIHSLIYKAFGWDKPEFIHLPLILKPLGKGKLSKRDGLIGGFPIFPLEWNKSPGFKDLGFLSSSMANYLALLGWSPGGKKEIYTLEELIKIFSIKGLQKGGAKFDFEKAKWINQQHLSDISYYDFEKKFPADLIELKRKYKLKSEKIFLLVRNRIKLGEDLKKEVRFFMKDPVNYDEKTLNKLKSKNNIEVLLSLIEKTIKDNNFNDLKENLVSLASDNKINLGSIMQLLRISIVGSLTGPDIIESSLILKKSLTLKRIINLKNHIKSNLS